MAETSHHRGLAVTLGVSSSGAAGDTSQAANLRPLRAPGKSSSSNLKRSKNKTIRRSYAFTQIETHPLRTTVC